MGALVLMRKEGERFTIGEHITIVVVAVKGPDVKLSITAPKELAILRPDMKNRLPPARRRSA